jgi:hypothetical protein
MPPELPPNEDEALCKRCGSQCETPYGYEPCDHGYCWPCASAVLEEVLGAELPHSERHLKPAIHHTVHGRSDLDGAWIQVPASGCIRPALARAFAAEILRACDQVEDESA